MKNKVKWLILLLILPLLCGAGEAEDPRALWREAEAALAGYDYVDMDAADEVTITLNGEETTGVTASRTRGSGLQGSAPAFQLVMTGDQIGEVYYANGTAYTNMPYGQWQCPMTVEDFSRLFGESVDFTEADFTVVEMVSANNGYEISFSQPTEELMERIAESLLGGFTALTDVDVSGTLRLHADGSMDETVLELSMTLQQPGGSEIPVSIYSSRKLLAHDESVVVYLPDKLSYFDKCEDVYAIKALYDAFSVMQDAMRSAYHTEVGINGKIQGSSRNLNYVSDVVLQRDLADDNYRYYYDFTEYRIGPFDDTPWQCYGYDLSPEKKLYLLPSGEVELDISEEDAREAMVDELREFNSLTTFAELEDIQAVYTENGMEISFRPSREMAVLLTSYVLEKQMDTLDFARALLEMDRWEFSNEAGLVILDEEGQLKSLYFSVDFTAFARGLLSEIGGLVSYRREVETINGPVEFPAEFRALQERYEARED